MKKSQTTETVSLRAKIREAENRINTISTTLKNLYEDKCTGKLPEATFLNLMDSFTKEQAEIEERLPILRRELDDIQETTGEIEDWLSLVGGYMELEEVERDIVTSLIESITVSERTEVENKKQQELEIKYRFIKNLLTNVNEGVA